MRKNQALERASLGGRGLGRDLLALPASRRWVAAFGLTLAAFGWGAAFRAPRANACSTLAPPPVLDGYPMDRATDVPTDVVPVYKTFLLADGQFSLSSQAGATIPVTRRNTFAWYWEAAPSTSLEPRTRYTLTVRVIPQNTSSAPYDISLAFTTGPGPVAAQPAPPPAKLTHYARTGAFSSCDVAPHGSCISVGSGFVQAVFIDGLNDPAIFETPGAGVGAQGPYLFEGSMPANLSGVDQGTSFIGVRLRTRAPNGVLSAPLDLYGRDAPIYQFGEGAKIECTSGGLAPQGVLVDAPVTPTGSVGSTSVGGAGGAGAPSAGTPRLASSNAGCSVAASTPGGASLLLAVALLASARRRRSRR